MREIILEAVEGIVHYPDPAYRALKNKLSKAEHVDQDNLIMMNGGIEAIHKTIEAIKPKKALVMAPTFVEYEKALKRVGSTIDYYLLSEANDFTFKVDEFLSKNFKAIDLVVICNPNNPTGQYIAKDQLSTLVHHLQKTNTKIMIDESFIDFLTPKDSTTALVNAYDNLFIIRSLTKFYAIPGLRLGFLITSNMDVKKFINTYSETWRVNTIANAVGLNVIDNQQYIKNTKKYLAIERNYLYKRLTTFDQLKVYPSTVNFIFFQTKIKINLKEALLKHNILIRHCNNYIGLNHHYYRVAVNARKENNQLINALKQILEDYQ
jgi:threonine-phosphate decarboxylase